MSVSNVTAAAGGRVIRQGIIRAGLQAQQQQQQQPQRPPQHAQNAILQASLAARVQQINFTIRKLQPKSAALRDPRARKDVERRLQDLSRQGMFITEAAKELDAILSERARAW